MERQKIDKIIDAFRSAMYQEFSVSEDVPTNAATGGGVGAATRPAPAQRSRVPSQQPSSQAATRRQPGRSGWRYALRCTARRVCESAFIYRVNP